MMQPVHGERMKAWLEDAWMQRYLARELDADDAEWFEAYLMDKADLIELIERDTALRDGVAQTPQAQGAKVVNLPRRLSQPGRDENDDAEVPLSRAPEHGVGSMLATRHGNSESRLHSARQNYFTYTRVLGFAASLVLGVALGWSGQSAVRPDVPTIVRSPTRIIFDTVRGDVTLPRVEHADSASEYILVEVAVPPGAEDIEIRFDNMREQLQSSPDGFVSFLLLRAAAVPERTLSYRTAGGKRIVRQLQFPSEIF